MRRTLAITALAVAGLALAGCFPPAPSDAPPKSAAVVDCERQAAAFVAAHAAIAAPRYQCVDDNPGLQHLRTGAWWEPWDRDVWIVAYPWQPSYLQTLGHETGHDWLRSVNAWAWASIRLGFWDSEDAADVFSLAVTGIWRASYCDPITRERCYEAPTADELARLQGAGLLP